MKNFKKQYFNMVEIVLALAVISVAIVSLMGIVPVALRASKISVEENSTVPVETLMKAYIDKKYKDYKNSSTAVFSDFLSNFYDGSSAEPSKNAPYDFSNKNNRQFTNADMKNYAFQITGINSTNSELKKAIFLVEYFSGEFKNGEFTKIDAAHDIRLWYVPFDGILYIPHNMPYTTQPNNGNDQEYGKNLIYSSTTNTEFVNGSNVKLDYGCTFFLEISSPSGSSYDKQEHKLYKYDYFRKVE